MRILMAGASGFLGTRLAERLQAGGHDIKRLVRRETTKPGEVTWRPSEGRLDSALVAEADAIVNLAGAGIGDHRWTPRYKSLLRSSRVDTTGTIARTIRQLPEADRPKALIQSSAIGWYGDSGDRPVTEEEPAGSTFLADLCRVWEAAARPAEDAGVRVALLRTGLPLSAEGGMLKPLLLPFRLGAGAKIAGGQQWMPWVSLRDWLAAVEFLIAREQVAGPVNIVGPTPATNADFTKALAAALHRPALFALPKVALRAGLGEMSGELWSSCRAVPGVLQQSAFDWKDQDIASALRAAVGTEAALRR
jgi:uncharacterized protein (TIGR01777 family)